MENTDSILDSIKKLLGPCGSYDHFDADLIFHINTALNVGRQLGIGPEEGFRIEGSSETWSDFWQGCHEVPMFKDYVYAKVKVAFDPPASSFAMEALKQNIAEFEWRSNVDVETPCLNELLES